MLKNLLKPFLIGSGTVVWSLTMVKSGLVYDYGVGFWGPNGHDGVWHISLARGLASGSGEMPIFAGEVIKNYHLGFDLLLALINKITSIPVSVLYFQIFPPIFAILIGLTTYKFVKRWKKSEGAALASTFFVYFGGSIAWILGRGESAFWAQPAILTLINPPFALSLVLVLSALTVLCSRRKFSIFSFLFLIISFGVLVQVKAYAGIVILGALFAASVYEFLKDKSREYFKLFLGSTVVSLIIFLPNINSSSLLEFKPFWFLETMMNSPDRLGWSRFGEAMVNYRLGGQWGKAILAYGAALFIFWYGNLGARFINEFYWMKRIKDKKLELLDVFFGAAILIGTAMSLLFVQKGTAWNTIQFFYYSLFFASIISGVVLDGIIKSSKNAAFKNLLVGGVIVFAIPTNIAVLRHYLPTRPPAMIPQHELAALEFLSTQPEGVVLVMPFDRGAADKALGNPPRPLYLYESTAYVSAYSGQPVWLEDEINLEITGYEWKGRREKLQRALDSGLDMREFLRSQNIRYVYLVEDKYEQSFSSLEEIYSNRGVKIYNSL